LAEAGPVTLTASEASAEIAKGALSAEEYTQACLERIAAVDKDIRAFVHLDRDHALAQARALDERRRKGAAIGPLHGIPVGIKDIIDTEDYPAECGSPVFAGRRPRRDATLVAKLRSAGAIIIGKTVTTECAYFHPGPTRNPRDLTRTPGGSSSGSAAAVAAGMVPLAIGSQTNGSVIRPASFCGVYAIKPSHGLISRAGVLVLSRALDHIGPFARTLDDLALALEVLAGYDVEDPDTRPIAVPPFRAMLAEKPAQPPRFAFVRTPIWEKKIGADARAAFEDLADRLKLESLDLPDRFAGAWDAHRTVMAVEMAHNLGAAVHRGGEASSKTLRDLLAAGSKIAAVDYLGARNEARALNRELAKFFEIYDAIITPATTGVAPKGLDATGDPAFCSLWSLLGVPTVTLPVLAGEGGLPIGVQLVGAAGDDARLLRNARALLNQIGKRGGDDIRNPVAASVGAAR
jgi:Asp-tRNA(Asn)/Glu-tRNA(Gln) amidotransferase A subunit family amidase